MCLIKRKGNENSQSAHLVLEDNLWLFNTFATADPPCLLEWPRTIRARPWLTPTQPQ